VVDVDVEPDMRSKCCLQDKEIIELATIAKEIEKHYGCAMDIEWAIDKDFSFPESVFIVQARPETIWSQRKKGSIIGEKSGYQLLMEQAMKRIKIQG
jgi:pyruvate,water dikinase